MTQTADAFSITRRAVDPRADGAVRTVHLSPSRVTIDRTLDGVRMRLGVPTACYRELVICVRAPSGRAVLRLRHDDAELDVVIGSGEAAEVARSARAWSAVTGKTVSVEVGAVIGTPHPRARALRSSGRPGRRSLRTAGRLGRFALRRKPGIPGRLRTHFGGEREIIARD